MKKRLALIAVSLCLLAACSPSNDVGSYLEDNPELLRQTVAQYLADHPEAIFVAIEKQPEAFMATAKKAAQEEQRLARERQMDAAFANPQQPKIDAGRVVFGNPKAPITIVEYSDFECPYCARVNPTIAKILDEYGEQVRVVYKHLPLNFHDLAKPAAEYFEAIGLQDPAKAKAFHDTLFNNQQIFTQQGQAYLHQVATELGVDLERLDNDRASTQVAERIDADLAEAQGFGFQGTPGFLINGVPLSGAKPYVEFQAIIDRHLAEG